MSPCKFTDKDLSLYWHFNCAKRCLLLKSPWINRLMGTLHDREVLHKPQKSCNKFSCEDVVLTGFFKNSYEQVFSFLRVLIFYKYTVKYLQVKKCLGILQIWGVESLGVNLTRLTTGLYSCGTGHVSCYTAWSPVDRTPGSGYLTEDDVYCFVWEFLSRKIPLSGAVEKQALAVNIPTIFINLKAKSLTTVFGKKTPDKQKHPQICLSTLFEISVTTWN